jgi:hypothetical protein
MRLKLVARFMHRGKSISSGQIASSYVLLNGAMSRDLILQDDDDAIYHDSHGMYTCHESR